MYSLTRRCPTCKYYYEYMFGFSSEKTRHFQPMISELCHYEILCMPVHIKIIQFPKCWYIMSWPSGPKSLNRDSGKITKIKVLKRIWIADRFWLRLKITARPVKRITGQYSLLRTSALTWVLDQSLSHKINRLYSLINVEPSSHELFLWCPLLLVPYTCA